MSPRVRFEEEADAEYRLPANTTKNVASILASSSLMPSTPTIDQILELPRAGTLVPGMPSELQVRRRAVRRFPYHVVYLEAPSQIWILAIAHDRRKPGYWKDRLGSSG